jgi:hypothetical protein
VLLTDREAEHIPGCNMAFRKSALKAIDGFDPLFNKAGDDVDVCWRLMERGWKLGFNPGAVVWHHRRNSVRTYWRQQKGYGAAEAMLERKWPDKYNAGGHISWAGRIYNNGFLQHLGWHRARIYQGTWGSEGYQKKEPAVPHIWEQLPLTPEWYLITLALAGLCALGALWRPLAWALPLLAPRGAAVRHIRERPPHAFAVAFCAPGIAGQAALAHGAAARAAAARASGWALEQRLDALASAHGRRALVPARQCAALLE